MNRPRTTRWSRCGPGVVESARLVCRVGLFSLSAPAWIGRYKFRGHRREPSRWVDDRRRLHVRQGDIESDPMKLLVPRIIKAQQRSRCGWPACDGDRYHDAPDRCEHIHSSPSPNVAGRSLWINFYGGVCAAWISHFMIRPRRKRQHAPRSNCCVFQDTPFGQPYRQIHETSNRWVSYNNVGAWLFVGGSGHGPGPPWFCAASSWPVPRRRQRLGPTTSLVSG